MKPLKKSPNKGVYWITHYGLNTPVPGWIGTDKYRSQVRAETREQAEELIKVRGLSEYLTGDTSKRSVHPTWVTLTRKHLYSGLDRVHYGIFLSSLGPETSNKAANLDNRWLHALVHDELNALSYMRADELAATRRYITESIHELESKYGLI